MYTRLYLGTYAVSPTVSVRHRSSWWRDRDRRVPVSAAAAAIAKATIAVVVAVTSAAAAAVRAVLPRGCFGSCCFCLRRI